MSSDTALIQPIKKLHVEATVQFAINHIPNVDEDTLVKYLELVNVTGNFGTISKEQLALKMLLIIKHIPNACQDSLQTLGELLEVPFPSDSNEDKMRPKNGKIVGTIAPVQKQKSVRPAAGWNH